MSKLSLRDLFAVVTIVALALGWWLDRSQVQSRLEAEKAELRYEAERSQKRVTILKGELEDVGAHVTLGEFSVGIAYPDEIMTCPHCGSEMDCEKCNAHGERWRWTRDQTNGESHFGTDSKSRPGSLIQNFSP